MVFDIEAIAKPCGNGRAGVPPPAADGDGTPSLPGFAIASIEKRAVIGQRSGLAKHKAVVACRSNPQPATLRLAENHNAELITSTAAAAETRRERQFGGNETSLPEIPDQRDVVGRRFQVMSYAL